jgi:hypothetical protein
MAESDDNMSAIMATLAKLQKEKDGEIKPPELRSLKNDYKSTKRGEKRNQYPCPGADKCKKLTCNHVFAKKNADGPSRYVLSLAPESKGLLFPHLAPGLLAWLPAPFGGCCLVTGL